MSKRSAGGEEEAKSKRARSDDEIKYRLPTEVAPSEYWVDIWPDFQACEFDGYVKIALTVAHSTHTITMHSFELSFYIENCLLSRGKEDSDALELSSLAFDLEMQRVTLIAAEELKVGEKYFLSIRYKGVLNDKLAGFYRSTYLDKASGEKKTMAVTQFEATDARRALPCWDEPSLKASFSVRLYAPNSHVKAISNMPLAQEPVCLFSTSANNNQSKSSSSNVFSFPGDNIEANKQLTRVPRAEEQIILYTFQQSPIMSTYLLAWIIGEFDFVEAYTSQGDGVNVRVYTPVGGKQQGQFALELSVRCLEFFSSWFGIAYPLPKLDMCAIPDFAAGAMENWGLLTYRHTKILVGPETSASQKQGAARTICHEIAHQWFGNLVTMHWWDDLWLNEGFARFMEFLAVDYLFPEWQIWDSFVNEVFSAAQRLDALESSHAIHISCWSPEEIAQIFDVISYAKGASVLRMLFFYLGEENFQKGLRLYLSRHAYKNARSSDLWQALEEGQDGEKKQVARIMDGWIHMTGYPLLTVSEASDSPLSLILVQSRFLSSGAKKAQPTPWIVPLTLTSRPHVNSLLETEVGKLNLPSGSDSAAGLPLKLNNQQSGFYRVQYSEKMLENIFANIHSLSASDQLGLQNDLFALSQSGHISTSQWLSRLPFFFPAANADSGDAVAADATTKGKKMNYFVLSSICANLRSVCKLNCEQNYYPKLQAFVVSLFAPIFEEIRWKNTPTGSDPHIFAMTRAEVISVLALADYSPVVSECRRLFMQGGEGEGAIQPDLKPVVYATAVRLGENKEYERALALYEQTNLAAEKQRCLDALGLSASSHNRSLKWAVEQVRAGDAPSLFASIASTPAGRKAAWSFLKANWSTLTTRFNSTLLPNIVGSIISGFSDEDVIPDILAFFAAYPCSVADRTISQGLELISSQAARRSRDISSLGNYLSSKQ